MRKKTLVAALFLGIVFAVPAPTHGQADQQTQTSLASSVAWPLGALAFRFTVTEGDAQHDLGSWSKAQGLDVTLDVIEYRAGGGTLTLHRAAGAQSLLVQDWLHRLAISLQPTTVTIVQRDRDGTALARWKFCGVFPTKWSIGSGSADSDVAIETLVVTYERLDGISR
jgi:hypothetical protein